jgi:hypothetical protein
MQTAYGIIKFSLHDYILSLFGHIYINKRDISIDNTTIINKDQKGGFAWDVLNPKMQLKEYYSAGSGLHGNIR